MSLRVTHRMVFKNGVLIRSKTKKDLKFADTHLYAFQNCFAVDQRLEFIYSYDDGIIVHTTNPMNQIKKIEYKYKVRDIAVGKEHIYLLNDTSLVLYSKSGFNVLTKDFKECRVKMIGDGLIGIQGRAELSIYTHAFICQSVFSAQCSFSGHDVLLLGDMNTVRVYIKGKKAFEVAMPGYVTSLVTDALFSKIYGATQDGKIYVLSLNGEELRMMEYHTKAVIEMKISFTGEYLYSSDGERICVWSTESGVVVGFVDVEEGVEGLEIFLVDEFGCDVSRVLI